MDIPTEAIAALAAMGTFVVWLVKYMLKMFTDHVQKQSDLLVQARNDAKLHDERSAEAHKIQCAALDEIVVKLRAINGRK